jgi:hypothetical protein
MTQKRLVLALITVVLFGCAKSKVGYVGELAVFVDGNQMHSGDSMSFQDKIVTKTFDVRNIGDKVLLLQAIELEPSDSGADLNPAFTLDLTGVGLPRPLQPTVGAYIDNVVFKVTYNPQKDTKTTANLVLTSSDPNNPTFNIKLTPSVLGPKIVVSPSNVTFKGTIPGVPQSQSFVITNEGTAPLTIKSQVRFKVESDEFMVTKQPDIQRNIYPWGSADTPQQTDFEIRYLAQDDQSDDNAVIIESNDPATPVLEVPVRGEVQMGEVAITHEDMNITGYLDFSGIVEADATCTKLVEVEVSNGFARIKKPVVSGGQGAYVAQWFKAGGSQAEKCAPYQGTEIPSTNDYYSLSPFEPTLYVAVTYTAPGGKGVDASLVISYEAKDSRSVEILMKGGTPKGIFEIAGAMNRLNVAFSVKKGGSQDRTVVVSNLGNGKLMVGNALIQKNYNIDPDAFEVVQPPLWPQEIEPFGLLPLTVRFSSANMGEMRQLGAQLLIQYQDPENGQNAQAKVTLSGEIVDDNIVLPVADPGSPSDYPSLKAGDYVTLDGSKSTGGTYPIPLTGYFWFVKSKPSLSPPNGGPPVYSRIFIETAGVEQKFPVKMPLDLPGDYEFGFFVVAGDNSAGWFYSDEATLTLTVQPSQ